MTAATGRGARIAGTDYHLPSRVVSNAELQAGHPQWQMDQVERQTGVKNRRRAEAGETALDLAEAACRKLAARPRCDLHGVDALLFCTESPDHVMPPNACLLQSRLGLPQTVAALDYTLACSGFIYGLYLAKALVQSGAASRVLLVTADTYSKWIHPDDRGPATLFGDGAAATLITAGQPGLGGFLLRTDGSRSSCFVVPAGGARTPRSAETATPVRSGRDSVRSAEHLHMNGPAVVDFVKQEIPPLVTQLLDQERLTLNDLDLVVFHQASQVTLDHLYGALGVPKDKQFYGIADVGNTVSASIPIALRDAECQGRLTPGMRLMLIGFGVGLSWGGCLLNWA